MLSMKRGTAIEFTHALVSKEIMIKTDIQTHGLFFKEFTHAQQSHAVFAYEWLGLGK
jgi:hypothetical protein